MCVQGHRSCCGSQRLGLAWLLSQRHLRLEGIKAHFFCSLNLPPFAFRYGTRPRTSRAEGAGCSCCSSTHWCFPTGIWEEEDTASQQHSDVELFSRRKQEPELLLLSLQRQHLPRSPWSKSQESSQLLQRCFPRSSLQYAQHCG